MAVRYAFVAVYNKPRHMVGASTFLGRVEVEAGVQLTLYEGAFSTEDFAAAVRAHGTTAMVPWIGGIASMPEITGTIARVWFGSVAWLLFYYRFMFFARFHIMRSVHAIILYSLMTCTIQRRGSYTTWASASPMRWATHAPTARQNASKLYQ